MESEKINQKLKQMWRRYRRTNVSEMRDVTQADIESGLGASSLISVSEADRENGSPKLGDKIARNPNNHRDQWLVSKEYFDENFKLLPNLRKNNL
jgi:hypothetical protein